MELKWDDWRALPKSAQEEYKFCVERKRKPVGIGAIVGGMILVVTAVICVLMLIAGGTLLHYEATRSLGLKTICTAPAVLVFGLSYTMFMIFIELYLQLRYIWSHREFCRKHLRRAK